MLDINVNKISTKVWENIVVGHMDFIFDSLAVRLCLTKCRKVVSLEPSYSNIRKNADDFKQIFVRRAMLPNVQRDFSKILKYRGVK